mmetsp:Transcript_16154/g.20300  ORF Transcript_16154/g.20300 Transcript_16154/m.20300 type:complete len:97 (+) Transcript_16154:2578-2868(+)
MPYFNPPIVNPPLQLFTHLRYRSKAFIFLFMMGTNGGTSDKCPLNGIAIPNVTFETNKLASESEFKQDVFQEQCASNKMSHIDISFNKFEHFIMES